MLVCNVVIPMFCKSFPCDWKMSFLKSYKIMVINPRNSYSIEINHTYFWIVILGMIYTANLLFKEVEVKITGWGNAYTTLSKCNTITDYSIYFFFYS